MKKILSFILVISIVLSVLTIGVGAETSTPSTTLDRANALKDLGLFMGSNAGFDLDRQPSRVEAIVMLIRVLGLESQALKSTYANPFKDVPSWATKYVSFAYAKGYTSGISKTAFGSNLIVTPEQFVTFMLRALGYKEGSPDFWLKFTFNTAIEKAESIGVVQIGKYKNGGKFTRGDCVDTIYNVLSSVKKPENTTMATYLVNKGIIDSKLAIKYGFAKEYKTIQIPLRQTANGPVISVEDIISSVPGAKYATLNGTTENIWYDDYTALYNNFFHCFFEHGDTLFPLEFFTKNYINIDESIKLYNTANSSAYNEKGEMLAAGEVRLDEARKNGYIEMVIFDNPIPYSAYEKGLEKFIGNAIEFPSDSIKCLEKAKINYTFISVKTGEKRVFLAGQSGNEGYSYRYSFNTEKYPELAKVVSYMEGPLPSGKSAMDVIRNEALRKYGVVGANWAGSYNLSIFVGFDGWFNKAEAWNNARIVTFADENNKLIGYTTIVPSSTNAVDVGVVDQVSYIE